VSRRRPRSVARTYSRSPQAAPKDNPTRRRPPSVRTMRGLYPWFIYKNNGRGQFATTPIIKYQPVPLESTSGDSSLNSPIGVTSENHAIIDFDGDGRLDAVVRETGATPNGWTGSFAWQVWPGDGTGGFGPRSYTRKMNACFGQFCFWRERAQRDGGTWGSRW